jgi:hypothetical protein
MKQKVTAILLALVISLGVVTPAAIVNAQDNETFIEGNQSAGNVTIPANITIAADTNLTEATTNETTPPVAAQLPVFPEGELTAPIAELGNQTEAAAKIPDNATQVLNLLDDAQIKIDEARNLIQSLQSQLEEAQRPEAEAPTNDTEQIIESANDSASDIIDIVDEEVTNDPEVVDDVGNVTEDVIDAIEDSINSEDNATIGAIENITEEVIEVIGNATENVDNSTTEVAIQNALVRLLTNLVSAQDYNQNLAQEDKDELKANLEDAIEELASEAADSLR